MTEYDAVLLVSFGGPEGPDDVLPFLQNVTRGRDIPAERLAVVGEHYANFGGISPINAQNRRIQTALQSALDRRRLDLPVYFGNRNWDPLLTDEVAQMAADGRTRVLAVFTSAYSSYSGCRQYQENLADAVAALPPAVDGEPPMTIDVVRAYYDHPGFIGPFVDATRTALASLPEADRAGAHLLFTAHSIPMGMAQTCDYEIQLREAARLVADQIDGGAHPYELVWQSRSGPPQVPWLEPDINDALRSIAATASAAVIVPIGFVSDHIEVVWDLDTEAAATARQVDLAMVRAATPGTEPDERFIEMFAELVAERLDSSHPRLALGRLPIRPDACPADCCARPARP